MSYQEPILTEAPTCDGCDNLQVLDAAVTGRCPAGKCEILYCPNCLTEWMSIGPAACRSCSGMPLTMRLRVTVRWWLWRRILIPLKKWRARR